MKERWAEQEIGIVIRARKILKEKGLPKDVDVKGICEAAGISRKTGYQWASKLEAGPSSQEQDLREELSRLKAENEELKRRHDDIQFENEGRKLAWKIHGVDELLANKKNTTRFRRKSKR
jgi:hypothetical protein